MKPFSPFLGTVTGILLAVAAVIFVMIFVRRENPPAIESSKPDPLPTSATGLPILSSRGGYVSSEACESCHPSEYVSWKKTYHRTMTQVATSESILGTYDDVHMQFRNRPYHFQSRDGEFWVTMADPEWEAALRLQGGDLESIADVPMVTRKVVMTTGSHNMQGYWIPGSKGNEVWQLPWYWLPEEQLWIPREGTFLEPPGGVRQFNMWNQTCIGCHSVNGNPGLGAHAEWQADSQVAELGIACEACHGPGFEHIEKHRNSGVPVSKKTAGALPDHTIFNPLKYDADLASQACAQCHSANDFRDYGEFFRTGIKFRPGKRLEEFRVIYDPKSPPEPPVEGYWKNGFWSDGANRVGGDEYLGMIGSACFEGGKLSCLSCHSMHHSDPDKQLIHGVASNEACLTCHENYRDSLTQHTHHVADSSGSLCYNCHMPHTSFALMRGLRSHRIDSPDVASSVQSGRPNACNQCHVDQSLQWTAEHISKWYDQPLPELSEPQKTTADSILHLLSGHAVQRALAAWSLGWKPAQEISGNDWQAPLLAHLLYDPYFAVRMVAYRALRKLPDLKKLDYYFMDAQEKCVKAGESVIQNWKPLVKKDTARLRRLLMNSTGRPDEPRVQDLLSKQDRSEIYIDE